MVNSLPHNSANHSARPLDAVNPERRPCLLPTQVQVPVACAIAHHTWSDLDRQWIHSTCGRTSIERELLHKAEQKINPLGTNFSRYWAYRTAYHNYDSLASIIACSSYGKREDFIRCCYCSFRCYDTLLCPLCCYWRLARTLHDEFGDAFSADREVFYIVVSVSTDPDETHGLIFRDCTAPDVQQLKVNAV